MRNRNNNLNEDLDRCVEECMPGTMCETEVPASPNRAREINIQPMDFGYVVRIGCQSFAIESVDKLISNLNEYLKDPNGIEKSWFSGNLLK